MTDPDLVARRLAHGDVDLAIVEDVVAHRLDDLHEFVRIARGWIEGGGHPPPSG